MQDLVVLDQVFVCVKFFANWADEDLNTLFGNGRPPPSFGRILADLLQNTSITYKIYFHWQLNDLLYCHEHVKIKPVKITNCNLNQQGLRNIAMWKKIFSVLHVFPGINRTSPSCGVSTIFCRFFWHRWGISASFDLV